MGFTSSAERLDILSKLISTHEREGIQQYLVLQQRILQIQTLLERSERMSVSTWCDQLPLESLEKKSLESREPLIHFLDPKLFKLDAMLEVLKELAKSPMEILPQSKELQELVTQLVRGKIQYEILLQAVLEEDQRVIARYAETLKMDPASFFFFINIPLQPFLIEIARKVSATFYDNWWRGECPICGRIPTVARLRKRRRYLMCNFCGAEYLSDLFLCVNCGNRDPYTLKFVQIEEQPESRIDFCTKCNRYLKVLLEDRLKEPLPRFLEDILTLDLDVQAKRVDLTRFH